MTEEEVHEITSDMLALAHALTGFHAKWTARVMNAGNVTVATEEIKEAYEAAADALEAAARELFDTELEGPRNSEVQPLVVV
jgi:hypothetical protein